MAKSKYESHVLPYLDKIAQWTEKGATAKSIAENLGLSYSVFRKYCQQNEALKATFTQAKKKPDDEVENALFRRACGIEYEERTYRTKRDEETGEDVEVCVKRVTKYIPPDPTSAIFWLCNRRPEQWRSKAQSETEDETETSGVVVLAPVMENPGPPEEEKQE